MATHSSILAWRIPRTGEPWGAIVHGVAESRTRLKQLSSSSLIADFYLFFIYFLLLFINF